MESSILLEHIVMPCNLILCDEVDSTNDALKRLVAELRFDSGAGFGKDDKNAAFVPHIVIAEQQTAGRGRFDRAWASPKGNVYLSLLLELAAPPERRSALSLIVACAVRKALLGICEGGAALKVGKPEQPVDEVLHKPERSAALKLKWPNDILLVAEGTEEKHDATGKAQGAPLDALAGIAQGTPLSVSLGKLVGILVETATDVQGIVRVIAGIGINIARPAGESNKQAAYLSDILPKAPKRELVAAAAINNIHTAIQTWEEHGFSFAPFCQEYERNLLLMEQEVAIHTFEGRIISEGVVRGVSSTGELLVEQSDGTTASIAAGEVTLRD
ncbi:MAG: biotin--[acetyl-CoA-carboxylase] ligase [Coriobacteriales bacterium]|jgi:BirA family biotin operon repressor/biotin-[acetyl-CoA-carboxylase] ligase|nr:biotin--[acetyl-CoA-carboxylase] ligase [Coriobacteriales bacterium]